MGEVGVFHSPGSLLASSCGWPVSRGRCCDRSGSRWASRESEVGTGAGTGADRRSASCGDGKPAREREEQHSSQPEVLRKRRL